MALHSYGLYSYDLCSIMAVSVLSAEPRSACRRQTPKAWAGPGGEASKTSRSDASGFEYQHAHTRAMDPPSAMPICSYGRMDLLHGFCFVSCRSASVCCCLISCSGLARTAFAIRSASGPFARDQTLTCIGMACIAMAYIAMAYIVMAYTVMAY